MSNKFKVLDKQITTFTEVEISPDARITSDGTSLTAIFPADDDTKTYVVGQFGYDGTEDEVSLPNGSIILNINATSIATLVPKQKYLNGGE